jgi:ankyrin repeat protein
MGAADEALYQAAKRGDLGGAEQALQGGADANYVFEDADRSCRTRTPVLYLACERHDAAAVRLLLAHGADPNCYYDERAAWGSDLKPSLIAAFPSAEIVRLLLEKGASPNTCHCWREDSNNETPALQIARGAGHEEIVALLRQHGAS